MEDYYLPKGTILNDRYEISAVIGSGGFGITYRAFDSLLNRFVAVKEFFISTWMIRLDDGKECLPITKSESEVEKLEKCRQSFLREGMIMERLKDIPYLSRILDRFSENNTEYIVMKLLGKESLMDRRKTQGIISSAEQFPMIEQVLYALEQIHEKGFIHRDICPNNLVLTEDGDLYLIDLGAATSCDKNSSLWTDQNFDHSGFESPEHSSLSEQGPWTDIYSICASIVYLLTGERVPDANIREKNDVVPAILKKAGLSSAQQNALLEGLSVNREKRNISARELRIALCGEKSETPYKGSVQYEAKTDIGHRNINQNNLSVNGLFCYEGSDFETSGELVCSYDKLYLAAVCEGVGGEHLGDFASRAVVQALRHFIEQSSDSTKLPERLLDDLLDQLNEKILSLGAKIGTVSTTLSMFFWKGNHYWCVNIGNSPIYMFRKGKLTQRSVPHTRAYAKMMSGKPVDSTDTGILTNYLGKKKAAGSQMAAISHGHLQKGDIFLICSNSITEVLDESQLKKCLKKKNQKRMESIWKNIVKNEDRDNCSAIILNF